MPDEPLGTVILTLKEVSAYLDHVQDFVSFGGAEPRISTPTAVKQRRAYREVDSRHCGSHCVDLASLAFRQEAI